MKICPICGCEYQPKRSNSPTCEKPLCKREYKLEYQRIYGRKWRRNAEHRKYKADKMKEYRERDKLSEQERTRKKPGCGAENDADSYASRQMAKTLAKAGKVDVRL